MNENTASLCKDALNDLHGEVCRRIRAGDRGLVEIPMDHNVRERDLPTGEHYYDYDSGDGRLLDAFYEFEGVVGHNIVLVNIYR